ncbi:immunogenic protein MPB64 [Mycobacterium intermedium]|uniref:Immunogenic protein MPB64 n=1 Tax=Mycobacterium intermedium TaxID=28445 RepID=A0A1E3S5Y4_MYCIE|nr:esterase [Mycobacterium intermedium]MCV6962746.1 DUF3298 domain-containing protein [Mycobacterium intermedium]ODQ97494.1 immunogenic protein MPB64 [Mycobacterium intermedium]OPE47583.1 immunogenic protein MPB64 [Mycobacterium intermedium]ORA96636.1 immunogenic protein MPB64 [Mycobacterium intermedium]
MRLFSVAVLVVAAAIFGSSVAPVAVAAPKDYCAELKGSTTGRTCVIQISDPGYSVDISFPVDFPDQKPVAEFISQTRDAFVNAAKSAAPHDKPYELKITPTEYNSAIPPRGTQTVVFKVYRTDAQPQTTFKAFNWDQTYRKAIKFTAARDDKQNTPLWQVEDPLKTVAPIVQAELQKQQAPTPTASPAPSGQSATTTPPPLAISPTALYDPANYQNFAVVNEGVIFFFDQGALLPDSAGALQVLVPRSAIDPMLA